jgi:hypothetical protein
MSFPSVTNQLALLFFHVAVGAANRIIRGLSASVEGGYSFDRELDYQRIDQIVKFDSAPYIQVELNYRFGFTHGVVINVGVDITL